MAGVEYDVGAAVVQARLVSADLARLAQHPVLAGAERVAVSPGIATRSPHTHTPTHTPSPPLYSVRTPSRSSVTRPQARAEEDTQASSRAGDCPAREMRRKIPREPPRNVKGIRDAAGRVSGTEWRGQLKARAGREQPTKRFREEICVELS